MSSGAAAKVKSPSGSKKKEKEVVAQQPRKEKATPKEPSENPFINVIKSKLREIVPIGITSKLWLLSTPAGINAFKQIVSLGASDLVTAQAFTEYFDNGSKGGRIDAARMREVKVKTIPAPGFLFDMDNLLARGASRAQVEKCKLVGTEYQSALAGVDEAEKEKAFLDCEELMQEMWKSYMHPLKDSSCNLTVTRPATSSAAQRTKLVMTKQTQQAMTGQFMKSVYPEMLARPEDGGPGYVYCAVCLEPTTNVEFVGFGLSSQKADASNRAKYEVCRKMGLIAGPAMDNGGEAYGEKHQGN